MITGFAALIVLSLLLLAMGFCLKEMGLETAIYALTINALIIIIVLTGAR